MEKKRNCFTEASNGETEKLVGNVVQRNMKNPQNMQERSKRAHLEKLIGRL